MALTLITPPTVEPISLSEAKASPSLRVAVATDDTAITALIRSARIAAENYSLHVFITRTLELVLDGFPTGGIELLCPPIQSVTSIKYIATDGTEQTLDPLLYSVDDDSSPGLTVPAYGKSWPATRDEVNAVRVRYVAGYGAAADVPEDIKTCIKAVTGIQYDNPQGFMLSGGALVPVQTFIDKVLEYYLRDYRFKAYSF